MTTFVTILFSILVLTGKTQKSIYIYTLFIDDVYLVHLQHFLRAVSPR